MKDKTAMHLVTGNKQDNLKFPVRASSYHDYEQQHCYDHAPAVNPEAATAVVELLMMDVRTPET
jgi:hypothetical protein